MLRAQRVALARLTMVALVVAAVVATVAEAASRTTINPFNMFGYFTVQSNIILAVVYVAVAVPVLRGRSARRPVQPADDRLVLARACAVTYIAVVGVVYALLLAPLGAAGGVPVAWANLALHVVTPLFGVADWLLAPDRRRLPLRNVGIMLVYPAVWVAVVLVRGATDGWFPYPFLDPATGYPTIVVYVLAIAVSITTVGLLVLAATRLPSTARMTESSPF